MRILQQHLDTMHYRPLIFIRPNQGIERAESIDMCYELEGNFGNILYYLK